MTLVIGDLLNATITAKNANDETTTTAIDLLIYVY